MHVYGVSSVIRPPPAGIRPFMASSLLFLVNPSVIRPPVIRPPSVILNEVKNLAFHCHRHDRSGVGMPAAARRVEIGLHVF